MHSELRRAIGLPFVLPLVLAAACAAPAEHVPEGADPPAVVEELPLEESVKPGINDRFLAEDLDVAQFVKAFEGESREIFTARRAILATLELGPGMAVGDVGAGTGLFTGPMAAAVGKEGAVYAVEISPQFVTHLRERAAEAGLDQVHAVLGNERSVDLPPASVDVVFLCDTYHHVEYPRSTLASIHTALRPEGRLVIVDFERIPGVSTAWTLGHVRAGKQEVIAEVSAAGFYLEDEVDVEGLEENYVVRFRPR